MATNKLNIKVNNIELSVPEGTKVLAAAKMAGFNIPTLCYLAGICNEGSCRVCVVEVKGARNLVASCSATVTDGMEIFTNTPKVIKARKTTLELILSNHEKKCLSCVRSGECELQKLSKEYGCDDVKYTGQELKFPVETNNDFLVRDNNKCILCRRCVAACRDIQAVGVIGPNKRGFETHIGCAFDKTLADVPCVSCGQCINVCPVGALREKDDTDKVAKLLEDPDKYVVVGTAPAVRAALGEEFGYPIGTDVEGKMVTALKMLGFNNVFDVDMSADMTIMEEGAEFLARLSDPTAALPMITSCSPGWIKFIEFYYPEYLANLSSCKSPQQMFGAIMKTYYAEKLKIDPAKLSVVTIMPCTAKKFEIKRDDQSASGYPDIDVVLTTRELGRFIKSRGINFTSLKDSAFDNPLGESSTAGLIFGVTGGVMEAALRTVAEVVEKKPLEKIDFQEVRGMQGIKTAELTLGGKKINIAVVSGLSNAKKIMEEIKSGKAEYHFIEIMACPGGCINGGGQPIVSADIRNSIDVKSERAKVLYSKDKASKLRKSHENPVVKKLYADYFSKPNSHKAHEILHTSYVKRKKFK